MKEKKRKERIGKGKKWNQNRGKQILRGKLRWNKM